jgi:iron(III) transport system ATP-binding protein
MYLQLKSITKDFVSRGGAHTAVLKGFSLDVNKGEFVCLVGASGCGKTTALRVIAGLEAPTAGEVFLDGADITFLPPERRDMAVVFQHYALFPHMNVFNNVAFGLTVRKFPRGEIRKKVEDVLDIVGLNGFSNRAPNELSGGQQQRVALARALVIHPRVLLCDEPLSNLDAALRVQMRTEIKNLQQRLNLTTVYVTHDEDEARFLADRVVEMGRVLS